MDTYSMMIILPVFLANIPILGSALGLLPQTIRTYKKYKDLFREMSVVESFIPLAVIIVINVVIMALLSSNNALRLYPFIPSLILNTELLIAIYSVIVNRKNATKFRKSGSRQKNDI